MKINKTFITLFVIFIIIYFSLGLSHPFFMDESIYSSLTKHFFTSSYQDFIKEMASTLGHPPLNILINSFFVYIFGFSEFSLRILTMLSALLLFPISYFLAREFSLSPKISSYLAFALSLIYPIFMVSHFSLSDTPALLFSCLSMLFFMKSIKNPRLMPLATLFAVIGFFFKQYAIFPCILLPYFFYRNKLKLNIYFILSGLFLITSIGGWMLFSYFTFSNAMSSYISIGFSPLLFLKKLGWIFFFSGFVILPFSFFLIKKIPLNRLYLLLLLPLSYISYDFLVSTVSKTGYSIHGRIPLFYHVLPHTIYLAFAFLCFLAFLLFLANISLKKEEDKILLVLLFSTIVLLSIPTSGRTGLSVVEERHIIYLIPMLLILCFKKIKINFLFFISLLALSLFSILWLFTLIASSQTAYDAAIYTNSLNSSFYAEPALIYANTSLLANITEAKYIISGEGFAGYDLIKNCQEVKVFNSKLFGLNIGSRKICEVK